LLQALTGRLAGRVPVQALREAAREIEAEQFWSALEAITSTLRRRERLELARSLARNRHVVAERRALRGDDAPARRELAARRLALLPSARLRPTLRRALVTGPEPVRLAAARGLALLRDVPALGWICSHPSALATRPLPAVSGLLRAFGPGARTWLIAALDRGIAQPRFECAVLDALGISRCRSARERIQSRLHSRERDVRVAAARSLGRLGMGEAIPSLIPALADPAWPVRAQAASALGRLRAAPAADALAGCVTDPAWWVRHHAAYALASIGPEGRDLLCELVLRSPDPFAREMAREALDQAVSRETA
ncbi:MAG TPA: HEAT repeat domain-containing protein, partial [Candidatus Acidoferrales bacterium]|nr:HEAT repeat domain-containing protein [Candidatus Acidoferrales bacterium]